MDPQENWLLYPARPAWCEVDTSALTHNTRRACGLVTPASLMAVVKADGFGHGLMETARAILAGGASYLGAAVPEEGIALRRGGVTAPILILGPVPPPRVLRTSPPGGYQPRPSSLTAAS